MKKQYISPATYAHNVHAERAFLAGGSVNFDKGSLTNEIENGGQAGDGQDSDSRRRRNIWDDDEEDW